MKYTTITTLAAMLLGTAGAIAQGDPATAYTKPSGFVTHTLKAGQFNLVGLTLHSPIAIAGAFETVSGTTLTDTGVDFTTVLTAGKTYILEVTENTADPSLVGTIQEITEWTATTLTTPQDLAVEGLAGETTGGANDGAKYQLRRAVTLQEILGSPPTLVSGAAEASSDVIWVPDSGGNFLRYFYKTSLGGGGAWYNANTNSEVVGDIPIVYADAFMVQLRDDSPDTQLVVTGAVKTGDVTIAVFNGFNLVSNVYPVGSTIQNSGIADSLTSGASEAASDVLWLPDGNGDFIRYFYKTSLGGAATWYNASTNTAVTADVDLTSAFFIQRGGAAKNVELDPPTGYDGL